MGKNRPIVGATLGIIIGIIWGLYLKINIVSFYILMFIFLIVAKIAKKPQIKRKFKIISIRKILRYIKLVLDFKTLILIIIFSIIFNFNIIILNNKYENLYSGLEQVDIIAKVVSNEITKEYKSTYKIKVEKVNKNVKYKGTYLYLDVANNLGINFKYGDYINVQGEYIVPSKATNYNGFDYSEYLKTLKIYGTVKLKNSQLLKENTNNTIFMLSNSIFIKIKETIKSSLDEEKANLLLGILIGNTEQIPDEMKEDFKKSSISHILAVSGLHVSYIIFAMNKLLEKTQGKSYDRILTIIFIIAYMFITNFTPSVVRASVMAIIAILAKLTYNKSDIWTNLSISLAIILSYNPYLIRTAGVLLTYGGTLGIILFQKNILQIFNDLSNKLYKYKTKNISIKIVNYIQETISVSFSAQIFIVPVIARFFNTISISFFITNFFVSFIVGAIIIIGFLVVISNLLFSKVVIIKFILEKLLEILISISKLGEYLPFSQLYIVTPEIWQIIIYYLAILILNIFYKISYKKRKTAFETRLINWKNLLKHLIRKNYKKNIKIIIVIIILFFILSVIPKNLKIYFIDVGQGDSTLIVTPGQQTIIIDGGGSENYNVGKNVLLPYLLERKINKIDYMIISHFDTDHCDGLFEILQELQVKQVIISRQGEDSENFQQFIKIVKNRKIKVTVVKKRRGINY